MATTFAAARRACGLALAGLAAFAASAHADPLGLYLGGGVGQANTKVDDLGFSEHHLGWKALVGLRPIDVVGAELEYVDLGHPSSAGTLGPADAHVRAAALFGHVYLPLPVPHLDVYVKAGLSRLQSTVNGPCSSGPPCSLFRFDRSDTEFAYGAGVQFHFSSLALRGEYERFRSPIGDPSFASASLIWSF